MRTERANICEPEQILQAVAVAQRFAKQLAGVDEENGRCGIDLRDEMQKRGRFALTSL